MSYIATSINDSPTIVEKAGAALGEVRGRAVKYDSDGNVVLTGAGEAAVGICILNNEAIEKGADVDIQIKDIGLVEAGAAIAKGDKLTTGADGVLVKATGTEPIIATAIEAASAAGRFIRAIIGR